MSPEFERILLALRTLTAVERKIVLDALHRMEGDGDE